MLQHCFKRCAKALTFLLLVLVTSQLSAQIGQTYFKYLNPTPTGINVNNVSFVDDNNGIAVGYNGGILKTTDGGATWQYGVYTFLDANGITVKPTLYNCHFVTPTIAYAVGEYGLFLKSTDGGMNWMKMDNPYTALGSTTYYPAAVFFTSATTGYMGGTRNSTVTNTAPYLYTTVDGGATWDSIPAPLGDSTYYGTVAAPSKFGINSMNKRILSIKFVDANTGYISGSGGIPSGLGISSAANHTLLWKYTSGTLKDYSVTKEKLIPHWVPNVSGSYSQFTPTSQNYWGMQPLNDSVVFLSAQNNGIMYRVKTGVNDKTADFLHPGEFVDGVYQMISGAVSTGGVPGIAAAQFPANSSMWRMAKSPDDKVFVTYGTNIDGGLTNYTADAGDTWMQASTSSGNNLSAIDIAPNGRITTFGGGGFVTDSLPGQPRRSVYNNFANSGFASTNAMAFADCDNVVAVGGFASLAASTDGGKTWTDKTNPSLAATLFSFYGMSFNQPTKLFASGTASGNGYVYSSADMGTTLDLLLTVPPLNGANTTIYGLASKGDSVWVGARRSKTSNPQFHAAYIFRSYNAGLTWDTITVETGATSASVMASVQVTFINHLVGFCYGTGGKLYRTSDAGNTWTNVSPDAAASFAQMSIVDDNTIFICGNSGRVFKSIDAGLTWTTITITPASIATESFIGNITGILFHDANNGYASGNGGRVFITNDGGTTWTADHAPNTAIFTIPRFAQPSVPAGTPFVNRKVIIGTASNEFYEYGNPLTIDINSTETVVNASCTNPNGGSITVSASGGIAPYTYSIDGINFQSSNQFTGLSQGPKTITIKESACGRTVAKTITVGFDDNLTLTASNDTLVCAGSPVQLQANSNDVNTTFAWTPATGLSNASISNPIATPATTTAYTVTASLNGCSRSEAVVVNIKDVNVNAGADVAVCLGTPVQLQATSDSTGVAYTWSPATGLSNTTISNPVATLNSSVNYTVTASLNGCTKTDNVMVTIRKINVNAGADLVICANVPTQLQATSDSTGVNYSWSPTSGLSNASISNPVATINSSRTYTVTASKYGCVATDAINITVNQNPVISAGPDKTIVDGYEVMLDGSGVGTPSALSWSPSATLISGATTFTPVAKPTTTTVYTLTVRNNNNCTTTDDVVVTVIPYCLKVMDAFTPNGDGMNDKWVVTNNGGSCTKQVFVTVFNRYGNVVYKNDNYTNDWDGTYKGKPVADGTYYYVVNYRLLNGLLVTLKGDVTILR